MNEILIYGDIGFEVQAKDIVSQLNEMSGAIDVRVDSYGGDVYAGISIMNALRRYPDEVTVHVDGMAASAASFIAVGGGDKVIMSPNSSLLIHGAWSQGMGNAEEMAQLSADLNQITDNLATIYAEKAGGEPSYWRDLMKKDTTFTAEQAVEAGLADMVAEFSKSANAEKRLAVMASHKSRLAANYGGVPEIESRVAPPPPNASRSESVANQTKEGDTMSILNQLADELGKSPEDVTKALTGFFNEVVPISGEVEVTYPSDVKIVPTEKITVAPVIGGDAPDDAGEPVVEPAGDATTTSLAEQAGLTFTMGDVADGFIAAVDDSGVVTITAPSGAEVGATAVFTVLVNDTPVALSVTVRSLSEDTGEDGTSVPDEGVAVPGAPVADQVVLDSATYSELRAAAQYGWKAMEAAKDTKLEAEVDAWIREGRISAGMRTKAVNAIKQNAGVARDLYGSNPVGTIPRAEVGYGVDDQSPNPQAQAMREKKNPFSKPKL